MAKKNIGPASAYAKRGFEGMDAAQKSMNEKGNQYMNEMNISVGGVSKGNYKPEKTDGIKMRGTGAATKGVMSRGPMA